MIQMQGVRIESRRNEAYFLYAAMTSDKHNDSKWAFLNSLREENQRPATILLEG